MGTNYYRIPTAEEMEAKRQALLEKINTLDMEPSNIERGFSYEIDNSFNWETPWDKFTEHTLVHLGKRSMGWKFCWNFHDNQYYSNKEELLAFIRSGRVVNEYGDEIFTGEFISMALNWGEPDGLIYDEEYEKRNVSRNNLFRGPKYWDKIVDGLRVSSSTDFS